MELKVCFVGTVRRRTFICCRNVRISASSAARDRNRSATIQTMSLTRSLIPQQHRPILDQLLVRLSLRQGQGAGMLDALAIVKPETVIRWHRAGFRAYWRWKSKPRGGRPKTPLENRAISREIR